MNGSAMPGREGGVVRGEGVARVAGAQTGRHVGALLRRRGGAAHLMGRLGVVAVVERAHRGADRGAAGEHHGEHDRVGAELGGRAHELTS